MKKTVTALTCFFLAVGFLCLQPEISWAQQMELIQRIPDEPLEDQPFDQLIFQFRGAQAEHMLQKSGLNHPQQVLMGAPAGFGAGFIDNRQRFDNGLPINQLVKGVQAFG